MAGEDGGAMDVGSFDKNVYHNKFFAMTLTVPPDWVIQNEEEREHLQKMGTKLLVGDDKNLEATVKAGKHSSGNLFSVFEYPQGSPVTFNPSIASVATDVSHLPGIKRGKDYQFQLKTLLESGAIQAEFPNNGETYVRKVGGVDFDVMDVEMHIRKIVIKQKYYSTIMKGYALSFIISSGDDDQQAALQKILESVSFGQQ
jgi:hypothetical protein